MKKTSNKLQLGKQTLKTLRVKTEIKTGVATAQCTDGATCVTCFNCHPATPACPN